MGKLYEGNKPFIFITYAYDDCKAVLPIIDRLVDAGYRVWYASCDNPETQSSASIFNRIDSCAFFLIFMSSALNRSHRCKDEIFYALNKSKKKLVVVIEEMNREDYDNGLWMRLNWQQAILRSEFTSEKKFIRKLIRNRTLRACRSKMPRPRNIAILLCIVFIALFLLLSPVLLNRFFARGRSKDFSIMDSHTNTVGVHPLENKGSKEQEAKELENEEELEVAPRDQLSDYTWRELKEISHRIAVAGNDAEGLSVAKMYHLIDPNGNLKDDPIEFSLSDGTLAMVRIVGFRHDEMTEGDLAGITFEFTYSPVTHRMNLSGSNAGGWERSEMRTWLNSDFFSMLPDDLKSCIVAVKKKTNNRGGLSEEDLSSVSSTNDMIWLFSMSEIYGKLSVQPDDALHFPIVYDAEGEQYKLYSDHDVSITNHSFCEKEGAFEYWWLRSPYIGHTYGFHMVGDDGAWRNGNHSDRGYGVSPGFCI